MDIKLTIFTLLILLSLRCSTKEGAYKVVKVREIDTGKVFKVSLSTKFHKGDTVVISHPFGYPHSKVILIQER